MRNADIGNCNQVSGLSVFETHSINEKKNLR